MLLSELFGDEPLVISPEERAFLEQASRLWARQFDQIIQENRGPRIKTRIHVKRTKQGG